MKANRNESNIVNVPFFKEEIKEDSIFFTNIISSSSRNAIISQAFKAQREGKISNAIKYYQFLNDKGIVNEVILNNFATLYFNRMDYQKAKTLYEKSIKLFPNSPDSYANIGVLFRELKKFEEAREFTLKALKIKPDFTNAYYNLGLIYNDLKNYDQALLSAKKAIQLQPNFAEAHNSYGSILREIGELDESVIVFRKAIKCKTEYLDAYINLGMTYKYLGELEKAIEILYKSLEVNTNNLGMKILALTDILICEFIIGEFNQVPKHYKEIAHLIDKGGLQEIKEEKNILHSVVFPKFVSEVYTTIVESAHLSLKSKIPHIGESHCLSFAYQSLFISSQTKYIQPVLIEGGKAFHLAKNNKNKWKSSLVKQIEKYKSSEEIFISFGEIDCRADEGILQFAKKKKLNIEQVCFETVNNYINYMELTLSPFFSSRYYFGVPAPVILNLTPTHLDKTRIELIKFFNQVLKNEVLRRDSFFIDVFELTTNENFENNKIHMIDNTHLSSTCLPLLFKKHLYSKSN